MPTRQRRKLRFCLPESLETRRLLAGTAVISAGSLVVTGTTDSEAITVNFSSALIVTFVASNGVSTSIRPTGAFTTGHITVDAGAGNDSVIISSNVTYTNSTITGGSGNDTLTGGNGADSISGGAGNDLLNGGSGADILEGAADEDTADYSGRTTAVTVTNDGVANDGAAGEGDNVLASTEEVLGGLANDTFNPNSASAKAYFFGNSGNDSLTATGGNNTVTGGIGNDTVTTGGGNDTFIMNDGYVDTVSADGGTNTGSFDTGDKRPGAVPPPPAGTAVAGADPAAPALPTPTPHVQPDPSFNGTGTNNGPEFGWSAVTAGTIDSTGRVILVGYKSVGTIGGGYGTDYDFVATRYKTDGTLDTGFGTGGQKQIDFRTATGIGYGTDDQAYGVTTDASDNIIIVGKTRMAIGSSLTSYDFGVIRLSATNGALDTSFSGDGVQTVSFSSGDDWATDAAVQPDGGIVIVGTTPYVPPIGAPESAAAASISTSSNLEFAVARLTATGAPDATFGTSGKASFNNILTNQTDVRVAIRNLGAGAVQIYVGGTFNLSESSGFGIMRLNTAGLPDATFSGDGVVTDNNSAVLRDIAVNGTGVVAVGQDGSQGVISTYDSVGTGTGSASTNSDSYANFNAVTVDGSGRFVVVGDDSSDYEVSRYLSGLSFDPAFNDGVPVTTDVSGAFDSALNVSVNGAGKITAAGYSEPFAGAAELGAAAPPVSGPEASAARYIESTFPADITSGIGTFLTYDQIENMSFPELSSTAVLTLKSVPDPFGVVRITLDNRPNTVFFSMIKDDLGHDLIAVQVNTIYMYYDPDKVSQFIVKSKGGDDFVSAQTGAMPIAGLTSGPASPPPITTPIVFKGGSGDDTFIGGAGNDTMIANSEEDGADLFKGGDGFDTVDYSARCSDVSVTLDGKANDGERCEGDNIWTDVEGVIGGDGCDFIKGNDAANTLDGRGGNDVILGQGGDDLIKGGKGNDLLIGGLGADNIQGEAGNDLLIAGMVTATDCSLQSVCSDSWPLSYVKKVGSIFKIGSMVAITNDSSPDVLSGGPGKDTFFADTVGPIPSMLDKITDLQPGEKVFEF